MYDAEGGVAEAAATRGRAGERKTRSRIQIAGERIRVLGAERSPPCEHERGDDEEAVQYCSSKCVARRAADLVGRRRSGSSGDARRPQTVRDVDRAGRLAPGQRLAKARTTCVALCSKTSSRTGLEGRGQAGRRARARRLLTRSKDRGQPRHPVDGVELVRGWDGGGSAVSGRRRAARRRTTVGGVSPAATRAKKSPWTSSQRGSAASPTVSEAGRVGASR